jgi:CRISPR/Cas system CSM-associated protein Csm3 (group 7 of RAMP superfamily)
LRARARRILNTLRPANEANAFINDLFGLEMRDEDKVMPRASRLWVRETEIKHAVHNRVQSRVKIDRFTGGSYPAALFDQQPVFTGEVTLDLTLQKPIEADVGLLLLLLKDLWTGDVPLGGEANVGRGRLRGREATLNWRGDTWTMQTNGDGLKIVGDRNVLEKAVEALRTIPIVEAQRWPRRSSRQ